MIPADHWHDNGDGTAWWVTADPIASSEGWAMTIDRPCDTCGGVASSVWPTARCPAGCIDGRHTFDIEVEGQCYPMMGHCCFAGCDLLSCGCCRHQPHFVQPDRTLRVSVVPGMVLPLHDGGIRLDQYPPNAVYWTKGDGWWVDSDFDNIITLPPAAKPGMWAVKVSNRDA